MRIAQVHVDEPQHLPTLLNTGPAPGMVWGGERAFLRPLGYSRDNSHKFIPDFVEEKQLRLHRLQ